MTSEKKVEKPEDKGSAEKDASKKKGAERFGKWLPLSAGIISATLGLQCGDPDTQCPPQMPCTQDAMDGADEIQDGGVTEDGDAIVEGDVDAGEEVDGSVEEDGADAGVVDGTDEDMDAGDVDQDGADAGTDMDVDGGEEVDGGVVDGDVVSDNDVVLPCEGVYNETVEDVEFPTNTPVNVGGYSITYALGTLARVAVDIRCDATGENVATGLALKMEDDNVIEVPTDSKKITITPYSRNAWGMLADVVVEDL